jgi:hypothetical protein
MTPADTLIQAIKERIAANIDKETIKEETLAAGHTEQIFEAAYAAATTARAIPPADTMPSFVELWLNGFAFLKQEWKFALILSVPLIISTIADMVVSEGAVTNEILTIASAVSFIFSLAYIYLTIVLIGKIVTAGDPQTYREARAWAAQNWLGLAWVYVLSALVILGGFVLFIIPGFVLSVLLYFSYYAYAVDGHTGVSALQESRRLFSGRFLTMFLKLLGLTSLTVAVFIGCMIIASGAFLLTGMVGEMVALSVFGVIVNVFAAFITVITLQAAYRFYLAAQATATAEPKGTFAYKALAVIGLILPIVLIGLAAFFYLNQDVFREEFQILQESVENNEPVQLELQAASFAATAYRVTNNDSFIGVCEFIREAGEQNDVVACNDSNEAWALTITRDGEQWCADSTGYNKQLGMALEERTECLPL